MVNRQSIKSIIEKCLTLSQMKNKLSQYSFTEKKELLQGRLTPLEWMEYNDSIKEYEEYYLKWQDNIAQGRVDEDKIPKIKSFLEDFFKEFYEDELFKYERRILENYWVTENEPPKINEDDYVYDEDKPYTEETMLDRNLIGDIEQEMIDYQEENLKLTEKERFWLSAYFFDEYVPLKHRINHDYESLDEYYSDDFELAEFNHDFPNILRHMDNAINKSEGLFHPTILFHGGPVDSSLTVGSHGVWKNYISTSFQEISMKGHNKSYEDYWDIIIYAPQGTKGICGNIRRQYTNKDGELRWDTGLNQYTFEHEYLLGRNTGYTVVDMDYENHRQFVLLD